MLHSHDGWHWQRLADGGVQITRRSMPRPDGSPDILNEHTLTAEAWASIVASVSARGETGDTFREALARHNEAHRG